MKPVTLQFSDLDQLWDFAQKVQFRNIEINKNEKTFSGNCNDKEIALALTFYEAVIIDEVEN